MFTVYCPGGRPETAIALSYGKIANTYNCEIADPGSPILRVCKLLRCRGPGRARPQQGPGGAADGGHTRPAEYIFQRETPPVGLVG